MKQFVLWFGRGQNGARIVYSILAICILGPLLLPGYVHTLDMAFAPHPPLLSDLRSSYALYAILHVMSFIVPMDYLQKIMLFAILLAGGFGAHRLSHWVSPLAKSMSRDWSAYIAGILYVVNPFTYDRFMAGHYAVLLGYAILPFFVMSLLKLVYKPTIKSAVILGVWVAAVGVVSIHMLGPVSIAALVAAAAAVWRYRKQLSLINTLVLCSLLAAGVFLVASCYWLVPLIFWHSATTDQIQQFTSVDRSAFATIGGNVVGAISNVMRLQGFWAESRGLFVLPQQVMPLWGLLGFVVIIIATVGVIWMWRRSRLFAVFFATCAVIAGWFSLGTTFGFVSAVNMWLTDHLPLFAGYREPQKFVALVALCYAVLVAAGCRAIATRISGANPRRIVIAIMIALPFLWTPTMLWGFADQLHSAPYPSDWSIVKTLIDQRAGETSVLFLPWHEYMNLDMAQRIVAVPSETYFGSRIIASHDPEYEGLGPDLSYPASATMQTSILPHAGDADFVSRLISAHVGYIILAKEYDYQKYQYLSVPGIQQVYDGPKMSLYEVTQKEIAQ